MQVCVSSHATLKHYNIIFYLLIDLILFYLFYFILFFLDIS